MPRNNSSKSHHGGFRRRQQEDPPKNGQEKLNGCIIPTGCIKGKPVDDYDTDTRITYCCNKECPFPKEVHGVCFDLWKEDCVKRVLRSVTAHRNDWTEQWLKDHLWHASCMKILAQKDNNCRCPCGGILCGGPIDRSNSFFDISATFNQELPKPIEPKRRQKTTLPNVQLAPPVKFTGPAFGHAAIPLVSIGKFAPEKSSEFDAKKTYHYEPLRSKKNISVPYAMRAYKPMPRWEDEYFNWV